MRILIVAQTPERFQDWQRHVREPALGPTGDAAARGETVFRTKTCIVCHSVAGERGPSSLARDLTHSYSAT